MSRAITRSNLSDFAPRGHYIALRVRFFFPAEEENALPGEWVDHYSHSKLLLSDPALSWAYRNEGTMRWSDLKAHDPAGIITQSGHFGLKYGLVASHHDSHGIVSYATFFKADEDYTKADAKRALAFLQSEHQRSAPPTNLTNAELEVLRAIRDGHRLKRVAFDLNVTEGAIKQRLRNARAKLGAATGTQAATLASSYGLI